MKKAFNNDKVVIALFGILLLIIVIVYIEISKNICIKKGNFYSYKCGCMVRSDKK